MNPLLDLFHCAVASLSSESEGVASSQCCSLATVFALYDSLLACSLARSIYNLL